MCGTTGNRPSKNVPVRKDPIHQNKFAESSVPVQPGQFPSLYPVVAKGNMIMRRKADPQKPARPTRPTEVKKLLKVTEVVEVLGVSKVKVYELLGSGLPSVKFDGARRDHLDKLRDWIEQYSAWGGS